MKAKAPVVRLVRGSSARVVSLTALALLALGVAIPSCGGDGTSIDTGTGSGVACAVACDGSTPVCDPATGTCVQCLPSNDACGTGQFCGDVTHTCLDGCKDDAACAPQSCNPATHQCVDCVDSSQCGDGFVCGPAGTCVEGCTPSQPCGGGLTCCANACVDILSDPYACGDCNSPCAPLAHAEVLCVQTACELGPCDAGWDNCNQIASDGCEWDLSVGPCSCTPGATQPCYTGPLGTEDVGTCTGGITTCDPSGASWGPCVGEVVPAFDACNDGQDNDCDGTADNAPDLDGDGWTPCDGDCCEVVAIDTCGDPALVNPGAFEVAGNDVDDDCDGVKDNPLASCDGGLASNSSNAADYAKAIDLCATTVENPPSLADKKWGVISASFARANGSGTPDPGQRSIRPQFGNNLAPQAGSNLAVLSTGVAAAQAAPSNTSPAFVKFQGGKSVGTTSPVPSDWLAANNNNFPNAPGCPDPQGGTTANDPIMLKIRVRVPTNARSFSVGTYFFSSEYPEWVCSAFNDFFLALLDSTFVPGPGQIANPADKNLAFYQTGNSIYPVGVNLATGNTGLFSQCQSSPTGCGGGAVPGNNTCSSTTQLLGTGFDDPNPPSQFAGDPAYCTGTATFAGGGTGWLTTSGNVKPGETVDLRFVLWDTGDGWYDSVALVDDFVWSLDASTPGTRP